MFNVTNTTAQMEPSTSYSSPSNSNNRKRFLNECDSPNNDYTMMHRTPPVTGYASRLHGCVPPIETEHENCQSPSMKRSRCTNYSFRTLTLSTAEYTKVVEFLAREAKVPRYTWVPTQVVSHILPTEGLERFLTAIKAGHDSVLFNANGIYTMGDMIREFEKHNDIFERIGIDSSKLSKYYEAFLSFYRIQEAMKLPK
ncbi:Transcription factor cep-1 [Caenorhabditis elegans]|nr:Transcription factor cep-1 [Caenorhabditis elegans]CAI79201.1 Transcription factor cep-1 [Caenorhabditis elegans]|eukprot:NP_001021479.1 Transcription factor cep-1 [Caenorhabditis elegans]